MFNRFPHFVYLCAWCVLFQVAGMARAQQVEPPRNPFLADSPWPITHGNSYLQGSSSFPGPQRTDRIRISFQEAEPVPVTLAYGPMDRNGNRAIWSNTFKNIFKIDANGNRWQYAARDRRLQSLRDSMSGAYSLVDRDGVFFVPRGLSIEAYRDAIPGNSLSGIQKAGEFRIPSERTRSSRELIVGLNMTYDGWLAFVTTHGTIGVVSRDFRSCAFARCEGNEQVSNSIAVDEEGGLYVVTSKKVYRFQWDGQCLRTRWVTPYKTSDQQFVGRLGAGSGTTPSLMGVGDQDKFVVIGDGQRLMHLVLIWRDEIPDDWFPLKGCDRRIAAEVPIRFGQCGTRRSSTEQSVLVSGYGAAVVSNDYGQIRPRPRNTVFSQAMRILLSGKKRIAPHGVERLTWDPETRVFESTWVNRCLSCPNAIPAMSRATQSMYFIGNRNETWTLEAVDWNTGATSFYIPLGRRLRFNSAYAGTQVGSDGDIVTGTLTGLLKFSIQ